MDSHMDSIFFSTNGEEGRGEEGTGKKEKKRKKEEKRTLQLFNIRLAKFSVGFSWR